MHCLGCACRRKRYLADGEGGGDANTPVEEKVIVTFNVATLNEVRAEAHESVLMREGYEFDIENKRF